MNPIRLWLKYYQLLNNVVWYICTHQARLGIFSWHCNYFCDCNTDTLSKYQQMPLAPAFQPAAAAELTGRKCNSLQGRKGIQQWERKKKTKKKKVLLKSRYSTFCRCTETATKWCPRSEESTCISIKPSRRIRVCKPELNILNNQSVIK